MAKKTNKVRWELVAATGAAIAASVYCVAPLVLLTLGISGAWISNLAAFEPYRHVFTEKKALSIKSMKLKPITAIFLFVEFVTAIEKLKP